MKVLKPGYGLNDGDLYASKNGAASPQTGKGSG
jgi:hypothetical protein